MGNKITLFFEASARRLLKQYQGCCVMNTLVTEDALKEWTGLKYPAEIELWLNKNKIAYLKGKGKRICTTLQAINRILIGDNQLIDELDFDL